MDGTGRLTVRTARDGDRVLVEIGDNRLGIPEAAAAHVLEPFYTTKPVGKGTGLGLAICWRIVVRRHGDLRFTSTPGHTRLLDAVAPHPERVTPGPGAQTGSRRAPPWAAMAQITKMSRVMMSSDQNG
jgi:signal transduction histidine kinase